MDSLSVGGHGSLLERLRKGRVGVGSPAYILGAGTVLQRERTFGNHLTSVGADNVDTQYPVGLGVGDELHDTVRVEVGLGSAVGAEWESADLVVDTSLLKLCLILTNPCDLWVGVHDGGDGVVVDVAVVLGQELNGSDGLFLSLVRKHGTESAVADDADVRDLGTVLGVDDQAAAVVGLQANVLETKTVGVRAAADRDKDDICVELKIKSVYVPV